MERIEEYEFRKDVYKTLTRFTNYKVFGFLSRERKSCGDDIIFFDRLMNEDEQLIAKANLKGKYVSINTLSFIKQFQCVINDSYAYYFYRNSDDIDKAVPSLYDSMSSVNAHFKNCFIRYWREKCTRSVKSMYYLFLTSDNLNPKYDGLGIQLSIQMYAKIKDFINEIKESLKLPDNAVSSAKQMTPTDLNEDFYDYIYKNIAAPGFPDAAKYLELFRSRYSSKIDFYHFILGMDYEKARISFGKNEHMSREINSLCEMVRTIVNHPKAFKIFNEHDKVESLASRIDSKMSSESPRFYHAYQKFLLSCNSSITDLYLKTIGLDKNEVKFKGLSADNSKDLLDLLRRITELIDENLAVTVNLTSQPIHQALQDYNLNLRQQQQIIKLFEKCGHFPLFAAISCCMSRMETRKQEISNRTLCINYDSKAEDLDGVAADLGITRERVRQLRESCLEELLHFPKIAITSDCLKDYDYRPQSNMDFNKIRHEEEVNFSNEYIIACIEAVNPSMSVVGNVRKALLKNSDYIRYLHLVPSYLSNLFDFKRFADNIEAMLKEKRFYPYRDDLEVFVKNQVDYNISETDFYEVLKECRLLLQDKYPDNIINSQLYFPANARKKIPDLIEDILREFNKPMTSEEIADQLNARYPELKQLPTKIGANALRNNNIVAVSRTSTYALTEWSNTEKRGGTIRDIAEEYLNSLIEPIAPLTDICEYISKFRNNVKPDSVKSNLLAESNNKFALYYKNDVVYIGYSDHSFDSSYIAQDKRHGRRTFEESIALLEDFIQNNHHFPLSSATDEDELRLYRFLNVCKTNLRKGILLPSHKTEINRIETQYAQFKGTKPSVIQLGESPEQWMAHLENYVRYITDNDSIPDSSSEEALWYNNNKRLFDSEQLPADKRSAFAALIRIARRIKNPDNQY